MGVGSQMYVCLTKFKLKYKNIFMLQEEKKEGFCCKILKNIIIGFFLIYWAFIQDVTE